MVSETMRKKLNCFVFFCLINFKIPFCSLNSTYFFNIYIFPFFIKIQAYQ